jgi:hypothetical protein
MQKDARTNKCLASLPHLVESASKRQPAEQARHNVTKLNNDMKLFALLTLAVSLVLVGCEKSSETTPPATNAPAPAK